MSIRCGLLLVVVLFSLFPVPGRTNPVDADHIRVSLITENTSVQPGRPFWVGLRLAPEPGWKTYWRNPGGSGLPTRLDWRLPPGAAAGEIQWPYPEKMEVQGVVSYGYDGEVLLPVRIDPPGTAEPGEVLPLTVEAAWLVCREICIPGKAELNLALPVTPEVPRADPRWRETFRQARARLPDSPRNWQAGFDREGEQLALVVNASEPVFADATGVDFFPYPQGLVQSGAPQQADWSGRRLELFQAAGRRLTTLPQRLTGVLVVTTGAGQAAYEVTATPGRGEFTAGEGATPGPATGLPLVIVLALAGGLLLNLMPCVFPVLSLKAIGLLEAVHVSPHGHHLHGLAYTLGVMMFFALVAGLLLALKAGGESIGWGFQLQQPWFVALLAYLLFILGLSFSGLLEFGWQLMGAGESLTRGNGYLGSFFTGALAAVVASPCTAPFMGSAVAFALAQPPVAALAVFLSLGLGMALPFLLIAYLPGLGRYLPRPGPWMNVFKQVMAFPLYLTGIWLLWVLGRQTSATGMAVVLIGVLALLFAVWLQHIKPPPRGRWRTVTQGLTALAIVAAFALLATPVFQNPTSVQGTVADDGGFWQPYSPARLEQLREAGRPVFVNMTADWCISCIANERVALSVPSVRQTFEDKGVVALKGDWTGGDPAITRVLESFGRSGVPLYVLYPPGGEPRVLPQWLTPGNVLASLESLGEADGR